MNDGISRLSSLSDSTGTLEAYSYLGLSTVVVRAHPQPNVDLSYAKRSGEGVGDAGDQYTGLDRFGRVVDQRWRNPTTGTATDRFQYGYDAAGNRTFRDNLVNTAFGELYTYDGLDQLASFQRGTLNGGRTGITGTVARSQGWATDAVGNFTGVTTNGTIQTRTANAQNEITAVGGATTPTYDANGNMTGDETGRQFGYDAWNRLVVVKNSGGTTLETLGYDGYGRRVTQTAGGTTTDLYYSAAWQVLTEKVGSATTVRYVWSPVYVDALVLRDRDTNADGTLDERLWVQQDANWNVTALVDGTGAVVERDVYDPFGVQSVFNVSWSSLGGSAYSWSSGFQGTFHDSIAGLNSHRGRWYSPTLQVWVTMDPIRFDGGDVRLNGFVGNNPTNATDPMGLWRLGIRIFGPIRIPRTPFSIAPFIDFSVGTGGVSLSAGISGGLYRGGLPVVTYFSPIGGKQPLGVGYPSVFWGFMGLGALRNQIPPPGMPGVPGVGIPAVPPPRPIPFPALPPWFPFVPNGGFFTPPPGVLIGPPGPMPPGMNQGALGFAYGNFIFADLIRINFS